MKKLPHNPVDPQHASEDSSELFRQLTDAVIPLRAAKRVSHPVKKPKPIPLQRVLDERAALEDSLSEHIAWEIDSESGDELVFLRNGLSRMTLKKLRRGHWVIQDELDLHGLTSVEARVQLVAFLNACLDAGARCVRIIHGKGLRSKNRESVLKTKVANWLMQRDEVLAFCQAPRNDGGGGAALVLLKAASRR